MNISGLIYDYQFQGLSIVDRSLSSNYTANSSKETEISDSDDDGLPFIRKIIARSKLIINLKLDDSDDNTSDKNTIEIS